MVERRRVARVKEEDVVILDVLFVKIQGDIRISNCLNFRNDCLQLGISHSPHQGMNGSKVDVETNSKMIEAWNEDNTMVNRDVN
ncbi:hypothetical protein FRX31_032440 [Thalictrum thalictroides]|uniref:Uncharacterized protein n=1 Tax=Thalictrum thalictroides TaxID=46969 RepID=A0A7J6V0Q4_THATH|nr:hypothetical protein FRX31_032440 [Thalictrum thalictroides]